MSSVTTASTNLPAEYVLEREPRPAGMALDWAWRKNRLAHIPGRDGLPLLGDTLRYMRNQEGYSEWMREEFGLVHRGNMFFRRSVVFGSPDAAHQILRDKDGVFSSKWGWENTIGRFFGRGLMLRDFEDHRLHRRVMQEAFKKPAMREYLAMMNPVIAEAIDGWGLRSGSFPFYPALKRLTLDLAGVVFTGLAPGGDLDRMNQAFITMARASFALIRRPVPPLLWWRGVRARGYLVELFAGLIAERRTHPDEAAGRSDLLSWMCRAVSAEGERLTDAEIIDHMIFLMLAAHDTTTSALTNMAWAIGASVQWQDRLRAAARSIPRDAVEWDDLDALADVELVLMEALRLHPPVTAIPRLTMRAVEIDGASVPEHTVVWLDPHMTHRLPEYWDEPLRFDPDRFSEARAEHRRHPGQYYPYSSGAHICLGKLFSVVQVKAVVHQLLRRYRVALPESYAPRRQLVPFPKPSDDLPVRLEPLPGS